MFNADNVKVGDVIKVKDVLSKEYPQNKYMEGETGIVNKIGKRGVFVTFNPEIMRKISITFLLFDEIETIIPPKPSDTIKAEIERLNIELEAALKREAVREMTLEEVEALVGCRVKIVATSV